MDTKIKFLNPREMHESEVRGEIINGRYLEKTENERTAKDGRPFTSVSYIFEQEDGAKIAVNQTGLLRYLVEEKENLTVGDKVRINYGGKDAKGFHSFDLRVTERVAE